MTRASRWLALLSGCLLAATLLAATLVGRPSIVTAQPADDLMGRINNEKMQAFEEKLSQRLNAEMARYVSRGQYVLSVKVLWNPDVVPAVQNPALSQDKQKLPGFPIFVRAPDTPANDEATPPFTRLTVRVLLDETLPEYYERFVRKLIPIVARFDSARGDQVVVVKETFPALPKGQQPPTLPEKELMQKVGEPPPGAQPPSYPGVTVPSREAAQIAYDEGRYPDALRIVQGGFQRATTNEERAQYLSMEGSILYTMSNPEAARASWQRALTFDPGNLEVNRMLNFLDTQQKKATP